RSAARAAAGREERIVAGVRRSMRAERVRIEAADARLRALDPRRVLERGYSITRDAHGRAVRAAADAAVGSLLVTETADGAIRSWVEEQ
ncbi:MAG TPA: exodeoxyribonuclease VII large subunit, partial [Acidimicrobiia bacterium]